MLCGKLYCSLLIVGMALAQGSVDPPWPPEGGPCPPAPPAAHLECFNLTLTNGDVSCAYGIEAGVYARGYAQFDIFYSTEALSRWRPLRCAAARWRPRPTRGPLCG